MGKQSRARVLGDHQAMAIARNIRVSPRKLNLVAQQIRGKKVDRALNAWRIPRVRNERSGDLSHPAIVYVIGPNGEIAYALGGHAEPARRLSPARPGLRPPSFSPRPSGRRSALSPRW